TARSRAAAAPRTSCSRITRCCWTWRSGCWPSSSSSTPPPGLPCPARREPRMTFEIGGDVDVDKIMAEIRARLEEKKKGLYTEAEIREIAERRLDAVLEAKDLRSDLVQDFRAAPERWNYAFETETIYRSSRGLVGRALETLRGILKPVQKLFWNPNPMITALSRQSDLNKYYVHLFHNL